MPRNLSTAKIIAGKTMSFKSAARYVSFLKNIVFRFVFESYVPNIIMASGVLSPAT